MQLSEKIVRKYMHELEGVKLLAQKRRGLGLTNIYILLSLKNATLDTASEAERDTSPDQERDRGNDPKRDTSPDKEYSSKNTQINNTKSFRKAHALKPKKEENKKTPGSHIAPLTTGNQKGMGGIRGNGSPLQKKTPTQKPVVKNEASKHPAPVYIGKPLTQEEIDEKRRNGQNASSFTPLTGIIPASHWQELEAKVAANPINGNGNGLHYNQTTKHAPDFIDALMEQFSTLLHDERENIPQNINRAAKLYWQAEASEEMMIAILHDTYTIAKRKQKIATPHSDGRPNKMPYFFSVLEDKLGLKPKQPN